MTFSLKSESKASRLVVPVNCVAEDQTGRFVYTVVEPEEGAAVVSRKTVTVGELTSDGLEITDGLENGDLIVTAGISKLMDGMKVKLLK